MACSIPASMSLAAITGVLLVGDIARVSRCLQRQMWSDGDSGNLFFPPQPLPWGGGKNLGVVTAKGHVGGEAATTRRIGSKVSRTGGLRESVTKGTALV
jgi:hypothetical protein